MIHVENTIFHFTSKEGFVGILKNGFKASFSLEEFDSPNGKIKRAYPVICFSDIPLSFMKKNIKEADKKGNYGKYGLGMKMQWVRRNGLNPVLYLEGNSNISSDLTNAIKSGYSISDHIKTITSSLENKIRSLNTKLSIGGDKNKCDEYKGELKEIRETHKLSQDILKVNEFQSQIFYYIKNYMGFLNGSHYKYYDEREWRWSAPLCDCGIPSALSEEAFEEWRGDRNKPKKLIDKYTLDFEIDDIECLILEDETIFDSLMKELKSLNRLDINENNYKKLYNKILRRK